MEMEKVLKINCISTIVDWNWNRNRVEMERKWDGKFTKKLVV